MRGPHEHGPGGLEIPECCRCGGAGTGTPTMADARRVLGSVFGFEGFRPGQEAVIEALLGGRNVLTVMPTGSDKSLCFRVPALVMDGLTVVSPLLALRLAGIAADGIHPGNAREDNAAAWHCAAEGETQVADPGRSDIAVTRDNDSMIRTVAVFVERGPRRNAPSLPLRRPEAAKVVFRALSPGGAMR